MCHLLVVQFPGFIPGTVVVAVGVVVVTGSGEVVLETVLVAALVVVDVTEVVGSVRSGAFVVAAEVVVEVEVPASETIPVLLVQT